MLTNYWYFWGKADKQSGQYHPLIYHMLDSACVAYTLWNIGLSQQLKACIQTSLMLPEETSAFWIAYLAGLHDIGKATPGFQVKVEYLAKELKDRGFKFPVGHNTNLGHGVMTSHIARQWLADEHFGGKYSDFTVQLADALGGHHGSFPDANPPIQSEFGRVRNGSRIWDHARKQLLEHYKLLIGDDLNYSLKPGNSSAGLLVFAGLVSVVDWIASAEEFFPYASHIPLEEYVILSKKRAESAVKQLHWVKPHILESMPSFYSWFNFPPRVLQESIVEIASELVSPGMVLIEAPMGEGKTEAAFYLAEAWLQHLGQQGCYISLPTMATANAIFPRFSADYLCRLHPQDSCRLRLLHGYASLAEGYRKFRAKAVYDEQYGGQSAEDWFSYKKRGLLSPYGVGTVDQALFSVLRARHNFVRLFGLAGKTVVIDEVHAFDVYTRTILERLIQWLSAMGSSVVLLSATLPGETRSALVKAYGGCMPETKCKYPRITVVSGGSAKSIHVAASATTKSVGIKWVDRNEDSLGQRLKESLSNGGCAVCICNTVGHAQNLYKILKAYFENDELSLFHARYPFAERERREHDTVVAFGKDAGKGGNPPRPRRAVLVATQVVEQSLDLDFDLMVTEIAPVDLILQRSGRLFRHSGTKRHSFTHPELWIMEPDFAQDLLPDFAESEEIYSDYILLRSFLILKEMTHIKVPDDIERLIQSVYDDKLYVPDNYAARMKSSECKYKQRLSDLVRNARERIIGIPDAEESLYDKASGYLEEDNPDIHRAFQALTRWSDRPSVQIICLHTDKDGMAYLDAELTLPVDLSTEPDEGIVRALMTQSMGISGETLYRYFSCETIPKGWRDIPALRYCRPALFYNGEITGDSFTLKLDKDLGGVIEYKSKKREEDK